MRIIFLCITAVIYAFLSTAQEIPMLHYTTKDGLPSNTVYGISRDSKGYLWFATDKGISKYNGLRFENYTTFDGIADNEIFGFCEDKLGRLWLQTFNGSLCFYKDGIFHSPLNTPYLRQQNKLPFIKFMLAQEDGSINMTFHNQSVFINVDSNSVRAYDLKKLGINGSPDNILCVEGTRYAGYSVITPHKTIITDTSCTIVTTRINNPDNFFEAYFGEATYLKGADGIYAIDQKLLVSFTHSSNLKHCAPAQGVTSLSVYKVLKSGSLIFVCTSDGIVVNDSIRLLTGIPASGIVQDIEGNYWITTLSKGVFKLHSDIFSIKRHDNIPKKNIVFAHLNKGQTFIATNDNDFYKYDNISGKYVFRYTKDGEAQNPPSFYPFWAVDRKGRYRNVYKGELIFINDTAGGRPKILSYKDNMFLGLKNMLATADGTYMVSLDNIHFIGNSPPSGKQLKIYKIRGVESRNRIFGIATDDSGALWYSTINRVYKTTGDSAVPQPQFGGLAFKWMEICGAYLVGATHEDQLVICTFSGEQMTIDTITGHNCLWKRPYKLDSRHLLVVTNNQYRIITFSPATAKPGYTVTILENSLLPTEPEYVCSDGRECLFFKDGSMYSIATKGLLKPVAPPGLLFTTVKAARRIIDISTLPGKISLPFAESKNIVISFSPLVFSGSGIIYEYSITRDSNTLWVPLKSEEINLLAPEYGDYTLQVRAKSLSSDFSEPIVLQLTIIKPFWAESWFRLLCVILFLGILTAGTRFVIRRRLSIKEKKHASEIRFLKSEYKALNALMNPHFIFNSLNSIQGLVNENDGKGANQYLQYFSELVRQNMHNISKELIPLQKEIDLVINYLKLEQLRFHGWLNYEIHIDEEVETELIMIPPLLIQPFVENAIKHGLLPRQSADNCLSIKIYDADDTTIVEIKDNGVGLKPAKGSQHESYGLSNLTSRIDQLNKINNSHISFSLQEIRKNGSTSGVLVVLEIR